MVLHTKIWNKIQTVTDESITDVMNTEWICNCYAEQNWCLVSLYMCKQMQARHNHSVTDKAPSQGAALTLTIFQRKNMTKNFVTCQPWNLSCPSQILWYDKWCNYQAPDFFPQTNCALQMENPGMFFETMQSYYSSVGALYHTPCFLASFWEVTEQNQIDCLACLCW